MCNILTAYHVQHVVLHATWYKGTAQLLSLTELKSHYLSFVLLAEPLIGDEGEETGVIIIIIIIIIIIMILFL